MGFSISIPSVGQPHATEDPKVGNALQTISTWGNGNIAGTDLAASAAIARSQLAGGFGNLVATSVGINTSVVDGKFYIVTAGTTTMTLPTPTANATIGVIANAGQTGAAPTTITRSSGVINGLGVTAATSIPLGAPGAYVVLVGDGTNWNIVAGQQDSGWIAPALLTGMSPTGGVFNVPAVRLQGDTVRARGSITQGASGNASSIGLFTIPASMVPAADARGSFVYLASGTTLTMAFWEASHSLGTFFQSTGTNGQTGSQFSLDAISWPLI